MQHNTNNMVDAYHRHKNLKLAATELGMKWQSLYVHLKNSGVAVTGDKARYGSDSDKLAIVGEREFSRLVPLAKDLNQNSFQAKCDFEVLGYKVDVKAARLTIGDKRSKIKRWAFSIKKQQLIADFFVCFCLEEGDQVRKVLLMPSEIVKGLQTISVTEVGKSKWNDYEVKKEELADFFNSLPTP